MNNNTNDKKYYTKYPATYFLKLYLQCELLNVLNDSHNDPEYRVHQVKPQSCDKLYEKAKHYAKQYYDDWERVIFVLFYAIKASTI